MVFSEKRNSLDMDRPLMERSILCFQWWGTRHTLPFSSSFRVTVMGLAKLMLAATCPVTVIESEMEASWQSAPTEPEDKPVISFTSKIKKVLMLQRSCTV